MDLLSFQALCESLVRVRSATKAEDAWTAIRAAQGDAKGMKEWVSARFGVAQEAGGEDVNAFLTAFKPDAAK